MTFLPLDYAVRNLGRSPPRLALSVGGSFLVVLLVLVAGAFVRGLETAVRQTGSPANIIILGIGSEESIERSEVSAGAAGEAAASIEGVRSSGGVLHVSPEVHAQLPLSPDPAAESPPLVMVRGVTPAAMLVHDRIQVVEGRLPRSGFDEVMVGAMAATKMGVDPAAVAIGNSVVIDRRPWTIVGRFVAPGTVVEAEVWTDLTDLKTALRRETDSCVIVTLDRAAGAEFEDVLAFTQMRLDLEITAMRESEYYAKLSAFFAPIRAVVWITAGLIALGALCGGLNTMYAAFASRVRELGTLQSIGFRRAAIVMSLIQESLLATITGALLAAAVGVFVLSGLSVRFSMGAFGLLVDPPVLVLGLAAGFVLGAVGALPPAWRCLRMTIPESLKAL